MSMSDHMKQDLSAQEQVLLSQEIKKHRKSIPMAYLWFLFGVHYAYFNNMVWLVLYWLSIWGFGVWACIDLVRIPSMVIKINEYAEKDALLQIMALRSVKSTQPQAPVGALSSPAPPAVSQAPQNITIQVSPSISAASGSVKDSTEETYQEELEKLASLRDKGIITDTEFNEKKKKILGL